MNKMKNYVHLFDTTSQFDGEYNGDAYDEPWLSYTFENEKVNYNKNPLGQELTFEIVASGSVVFRNSGTMQYSKNGGEWTSMPTGTTGINVAVGDKVRFRDSATRAVSGATSASTATFKVSGNIMSLVHPTDFEKNHVLPGDYTFSGMFRNTSKVIDASNLLLPAKSLTYGCYSAMFNTCTGLTGAPELPAMELANECYHGMFLNTGLVTCPELPAMVVKNQSYRSMFADCANLTTACELPATTIDAGSYWDMFRYCTKLTKAPSILPAMTLFDDCYDQMFQFDSSLETAPELPAPVVAGAAYYQMFQYCSKLKNVKCLATNISARVCTDGWLGGTSTTGTFTKAASMTWPRNTSGIPTGWTVVDA